MDVLQRLYEILSPHCTDSVLSRAPKLTKAGYQKVARALGCDEEQVKQYIFQLANKITKQQQDDEGELPSGVSGFSLSEGVDDRYSSEEDATGSITIRDNKTGKSRFLSGQDATKLRNRMAKEDPQAVLASMFPLTEDADAEIVPDELAKDFGTFNFPYKDLMATVAYSVQNGQPHLEVVSLRNHEGEEVDLDENLKIALTAQAVKWIPNV